MKPIFLDASGIIGVLNTRDAWHAEAEAIWAQFIASSTSLVTTSLVLIEIGDALARPQHRQLAVATRDRLHHWRQVEVVDVTPQLELRAWDLYRSRPDKSWGITDCTSMVVMKDLQVTQAFTGDRHFEQAGFQILLKGDAANR